MSKFNIIEESKLSFPRPGYKYHQCSFESVSNLKIPLLITKRSKKETISKRDEHELGNYFYLFAQRTRIADTRTGGT